MSWCRAHSGACDLPVWRFLSEICCLFSMGCPLWREDRSAVYSAIIQRSESTEPVTILYCLIWDSPNPQSPEQGGTGLPLRRLLRLAGLRWRYSNPPARGRIKFKRARLSLYSLGVNSKTKHRFPCCCVHYHGYVFTEALLSKVCVS
jgi:hypothetical protein